MIQVQTKNGWVLKSHRTQGNDTWEFISCGEKSLADEVYKLVREMGKFCKIGFSSYGWYVMIEIND